MADGRGDAKRILRSVCIIDRGGIVAVIDQFRADLETGLDPGDDLAHAFLDTVLNGGVEVRTVPATMASPGMTLCAWPPCICVTDRTALALAGALRETMVFNCCTSDAAARSASLVSCGTAAWPRVRAG
jgi:hypothetical protein